MPNFKAVSEAAEGGAAPAEDGAAAISRPIDRPPPGVPGVRSSARGAAIGADDRPEGSMSGAHYGGEAWWGGNAGSAQLLSGSYLSYHWAMEIAFMGKVARQLLRSSWAGEK